MLNTIPQMQIISIDLIGVAQGKSPLQDVFQFPDIARKVMASQVVHGRWR